MKDKEEKILENTLSILSSALASIVVCSSITIGANAISLKKDKEEYQEALSNYEMYYDSNKEEQFEIDLILLSICENNNLNSYEKETLCQLSSVIENNPYLDKDSIYSKFKNLVVKREDKKVKKKKQLFSDKKLNYLGSYNYNMNIMNFYDYSNISSSTIVHEGLHLIFPCNNISSFFAEGFAEVLNEEYFNDTYDDSTAYKQEKAYIRTLCELLGSTTVLEVASTNDKELLEDKLNVIFHDKEVVKRWLDPEKVDENQFLDYYDDLNKVMKEQNYDNDKKEIIDNLYCDFLLGTNSYKSKNYFNISFPVEKQKALS